MQRTYSLKSLSLIMAVVMMLALVLSTNMTVSVCADSDSDSRYVAYNPGGGSGGGSGGGGGGGGGSSYIRKTTSGGLLNYSSIPIGHRLGAVGTTGTASVGSVSVATATKATSSAVAAAVAQARSTGASQARARVTFANAGTLTSDIFNAIANAALSAGKGMSVSVVVNADTLDATGAVAARMSIDVALAVQSGRSINTSIDVNANSRTNAAIANHLENYFANDMAVVTFGQKGSFGMNVPVALKADLSALNVNSLQFYSYDVASNNYSEIATEYSIDRNGYVHFTTPTGNSVVITDAPLTAK